MLLHLKDNIKLIRKLCGNTQPEFAAKFTGVTTPMQKSYESGKAEPGPLYLEELSEIASVSEKDLRGKKLSKNDIKVVNKVEKGNEQHYELINITDDIRKVLRDQQEAIIRLEARVTVLTTTLAISVSTQTGKTAAYVGSEIAESIDKETGRLLAELKRKQSS